MSQDVQLLEKPPTASEQLDVGEDLFPLDGAMSTAEFALRGRGGPIPREAWPELRVLRGSAV